MTTDIQPITKSEKDHGMSHSPRPRKTLVKAQPGLYVTVGPAGDENGASNAKHQSESLEALFKQLGMSEPGKSDPCEREWEGRDKDGQVIWKSPKLENPLRAARFRADELVFVE